MVIDVGNYEDNDGDDEGSTDIEISEPQPVEENNGGSSNDDTGNVVVTGDPSEGEDVTTVGVGDTQEEARQDAATNPDFDADQGDPVNEIEREMGTNQPLQNPEGSSTEEVKQAAEEIAGSDRFRGERTGRQAGELAQAIQQGQNQFDSVELQRNQGELQVIGRRKSRDNSRNQRRNTQQSNEQFEEYTDIGTLVNPTKGNPNATLAEELTTAGVDLMQKGQDFGRSVSNKLPSRQDAEDFSLGVIGDVTKTANEKYGIGSKENRQVFLNNAETFLDNFPETQQSSSLSRGVARTGDVIETGVTGYNQQGEFSTEEIVDAVTITDSEKKSARRDVLSGIAAGPSQISGLALSSTGAIPRASSTTTQNVLNVEEENREVAQSSNTGLLEGSTQGVVLTAEQAAKNPDQFVGEEVGEEIGEAIVFGGLTGGAGLAVSAVPTPEFEVTPDVRGRAASARNTVQQMRQSDSTTKAAGGQLLTNNVNTDTLAATTQQPDTEVGPGTTPGPRSSKPEPETQTDTLSGVETRQDIITENTETDTTLETDFFGSRTRSGSPSIEDVISTPEETSQPDSDALNRPESDILGEIDTRTEPDTRSEPDITADVLAETETEPEPELRIQNEVIPELNQRPDGDTSRQTDNEEENGLLDGLTSSSQEFERTVSVGAEVIGLESSSQESQLSAGNPLNLRPDIK